MFGIGAGSQLVASFTPKSQYRDPQWKGTLQEYQEALGQTKTVYVGNLSFHTTEEQLYEVFRGAGELRSIVMGLDRAKHTPCGFCFVEFYTRNDMLHALWWVQRVDERVIKVDLDPGFVEGRQYGRGMSGGQARDEARQTYDRGRGGYSALFRQQERGGGRRRGGSDSEDSRDSPARGGKRLREEDAALPPHLADLAPAPPDDADADADADADGGAPAKRARPDDDQEME
jgi:nuclear cap-binding protein subunit 2